ncbi:MAG TPA: hypothetical protein VGF96_14735 [Terracidiphilus sp.]|jgi:hypothetical protein
MPCRYLFGDICSALRRLRRSPGFALMAVLTLAPGAGATTAILKLARAMTLESLPVTKRSELDRIGGKASARERRWPASCNRAGYMIRAFLAWPCCCRA